MDIALAIAKQKAIRSYILAIWRTDHIDVL